MLLRLIDVEDWCNCKGSMGMVGGMVGIVGLVFIRVLIFIFRDFRSRGLGLSFWFRVACLVSRCLIFIAS